MCTRYNLLKSPRKWLKGVEYRYDPVFSPSFNIGPSRIAPVVRQLPTGGLALVPMTWGYLPQDYKGKATAKWNNARCETVFENRLWADAIEHRRCLVPATGYYEFVGSAGNKDPYHLWIKPGTLTTGGRPFLMAGIWGRWEGPDGPEERFAIITREPNETAAKVHDRMPVIISMKDMRRWFSYPDNWMFSGAPASVLEVQQVSRRLNKVGNEGPYVLQPRGVM